MSRVEYRWESIEISRSCSFGKNRSAFPLEILTIASVEIKGNESETQGVRGLGGSLPLANLTPLGENHEVFEFPNGQGTHSLQRNPSNSTALDRRAAMFRNAAPY